MKMSGIHSHHLKAEELGPNVRVTVTIDEVKIEQLGEDKKPVLYFAGKEKGLVLNKTNTTALIDLLGSDESDDWIGKRVALYTTKVDYQGKRVLAIRIDEAPRESRVASRPAPRVVEPVDSDTDAVTSDEIPFAWALPIILPLVFATHTVLA